MPTDWPRHAILILTPLKWQVPDGIQRGLVCFFVWMKSTQALAGDVECL